MQTEWEAAFWPVETDDIRSRLTTARATLKYAMRTMRRVNFYLPESTGSKGFARVRDEGDRVTLTVKDMSGTRIEEQLEAEVTVDSFEQAQEILRAVGCKNKNFQETRRECWTLDDTEVVIDEWPFLEPLAEIEGGSESAVRAVSEKLGFVWSDARFCSTDKMYAERYGVDPSFIIEGIPRLTFDMPDPFASLPGK